MPPSAAWLVRPYHVKLRLTAREAITVGPAWNFVQEIFNLSRPARGQRVDAPGCAALAFIDQILHLGRQQPIRQRNGSRR